MLQKPTGVKRSCEIILGNNTVVEMFLKRSRGAHWFALYMYCRANLPSMSSR